VKLQAPIPFEPPEEALYTEDHFLGSCRSYFPPSSHFLEEIRTEPVQSHGWISINSLEGDWALRLFLQRVYRMLGEYVVNRLALRKRAFVQVPEDHPAFAELTALGIPPVCVRFGTGMGRGPRVFLFVWTDWERAALQQCQQKHAKNGQDALGDALQRRDVRMS